MVVVERAPDLECGALGASSTLSPTCIMILGNTLPFLCLSFHICAVRVIIGKLEDLIFKTFFRPTGVPGVPRMCQSPCWALGTRW